MLAHTRMCKCTCKNKHTHTSKNPRHYSVTGMGIGTPEFQYWLLCCVNFNKSLSFWASISSSVKKSAGQIISNILSRSEISDSNSEHERNKAVSHWLRLGATRWLQCNRDGRGRGALPECPAQRMTMQWKMRAVLEWHSGSWGCPFSSLWHFYLLFSSCSSFRPVPLGFRSAKRLTTDFRSGFKGALLSLQAEPTAGSLSLAQVMGVPCENWKPGPFQ